MAGQGRGGLFLRASYFVAVLERGHAYLFPEERAEIARVFESAVEGDLLTVQLGGVEQLLAPQNAHLEDVVERGESGVLFENASEISVVELEIFGDQHRGEVGLQILLDEELRAVDRLLDFRNFERLAFAVRIDDAEHVVDVAGQQLLVAGRLFLRDLDSLRVEGDQPFRNSDAEYRRIEEQEDMTRLDLRQLAVRRFENTLSGHQIDELVFVQNTPFFRRKYVLLRVFFRGG